MSRPGRLGQHGEGHVPVELRVAGLPDLTHPAFADLGGDLVGAEGGAGVKGHGYGIGTRALSSSNQFCTSTT